MIRYKLLETVMLGFNTHNNQYDAFYDPGPDSVVLEREDGGDTIFVTHNGKRKESITQGHAIDVWLEDGKIAKIDD